MINVVVFIVKGWFLVFVMMWVRWTLPRLRIDQVMMTCLKYLLPISCVLLLGVSCGSWWCPHVVQVYFSMRCGRVAGCLVLSACWSSRGRWPAAADRHAGHVADRRRAGLSGSETSRESGWRALAGQARDA